MQDAASTVVLSGDASLDELVETLENMRQRLAEVLSGSAGGRSGAALEQCVRSLEDVSAALRSVSQLCDPSRSREFATQNQEVQLLTATVSETIAELAEANERIARKLGEQAGEFGRIAELPAGEALAPRLRASVTTVRAVTGEIRRNVNSITSRVNKATERIETLERELEEARERAAHDALTRLHSRAALDQHLDNAIRRRDASGPWCVLLIDIDHFKRVNDTHGHVVGDALLYNVARVLERSVRWKVGNDLVARYGGEEFAVVLGHSGLTEAASVAERLRESVATTRWQIRGEATQLVLNVTISIGVAQHRDGDSVAGLVERADRALYRAKGTGRNRVVVAEP